MVSISATDVITPTLNELESVPNNEVHSTHATCYVQKTVSGTWSEKWYISGNYLIDAWFTPSGGLSNVYYNGHYHTGTLSSYAGVDPGYGYPTTGYEDGGSSSSTYTKVWKYATAVYSGYLTCVLDEDYE